MSIPILVFYHGLFLMGDPPELLPAAAEIIKDQMDRMAECGLTEAASEIRIGINGGVESTAFAYLLPSKAQIFYHGLQCRNEIRTMLLIEERLKQLEGEAYCLYFHAKGASFPPGDIVRGRWRDRMFDNVVMKWKRALADLDSGFDAVGCHWLTPEQYRGLVGHPYFGGNYWIARASFLRTLPSLRETKEVKTHGIDAFESRYIAESWIGLGAKRPAIRDYHPGWPA